jgi:hypothetical protein
MRGRQQYSEQQRHMELTACLDNSVGLFNDAFSSSEFIKHEITWGNYQELKFVRVSM